MANARMKTNVWQVHMTVTCMQLVKMILVIFNVNVMMDSLVMVLEFWVALISMNATLILVSIQNIALIPWEGIGSTKSMCRKL